MSLFQKWAICADYFGDELPFPLPAVKKTEQKKNKTDSTDNSNNRAFTMTPSFDGLFHFDTMEQKKEKKKNVDLTDTTTAKSSNVGESNKDNSSKNRGGLTIAPAFDGLFPFETFVSR